MICWNEAQTIDLALKSIADLVDEVIIVDTGSFDDTQKIARETLDDLNLSGQIREVKVTNLLDARQIAFYLCASEWVLVQDANLVLTKSLKREILIHAQEHPPATGCIHSLNLMGDYEHLFGNRPFMAHHKDFIRRDRVVWDTDKDHPTYSGPRRGFSSWAVNLSRVRPAWRYWLRGEAFDRRYYDESARKRNDGHQNEYNTQYHWQKTKKHLSLLEYVKDTRGVTLKDVKRIAPQWFLNQLRLEARRLIPAYTRNLPVIIKEELKNPRYKLIYEEGKIIGRYPEL